MASSASLAGNETLDAPASNLGTSSLVVVGPDSLPPPPTSRTASASKSAPVLAHGNAVKVERGSVAASVKREPDAEQPPLAASAVKRLDTVKAEAVKREVLDKADGGPVKRERAEDNVKEEGEADEDEQGACARVGLLAFAQGTIAEASRKERKLDTEPPPQLGTSSAAQVLSLL